MYLKTYRKIYFLDKISMTRFSGKVSSYSVWNI